MRRAALLAALAALLASAAAAKTPLPPKPVGTGSEPTAGGGLLGGVPFRAAYALAQLDVSFGDVEIYLFPARVACRRIFFTDPPYVKVILHTEGTPPLVGRPSLSNGRDFVQVNFAVGTRIYAIQPGVRLVLTRVDTRPRGVWHGRLTVSKQTFSGLVFSYDGTFSARWCGHN